MIDSVKSCVNRNVNIADIRGIILTSFKKASHWLFSMIIGFEKVCHRSGDI